MDTELRAAYRQLSKTLQSVKRGSPTTYEARFLNFIIQRYFLSLHVPWYDLGLHDAAFAYSRRVVIETASKIWHATSGEDDLARLSICGAGFFRSAPVMASLAIAVELRTHLLEEESLGPKAPRPDLLAILYDAKDWSLKRIEAGETNIKGHLSIAALCVSPPSFHPHYSVPYRVTVNGTYLTAYIRPKLTQWHRGYMTRKFTRPL